MIIFIDVSKKNQVLLKLIEINGYREKLIESEFPDLLNCISDFLIKEKINLNDLSGIAIKQDYPTFTSARIATVTANSLAFALKIPVLGVDDKLACNCELLLKKIHKMKKNGIVKPQYNGEPNIRIKKARISQIADHR
ncbi:MAG: hypothetical protein ABH832_00165 [bacterium]